MKGFLNIKTYVENEGLITTNVGFSNGIIEYIGNEEKIIDEPLDFNSEAILLPGFIDEHVHGANGFDVMDKTETAIGGLGKALAMEGTTSFLATTMTESKENILKSLNAVNNFIKGEKDFGARVLGAHLEGPFISKNYIGAQPIDFIEKPSIKTFSEFQKASGNNIKIVSLAPEENADKLIKYLKENGIIASAGHTNATYQDVDNAIKNGLSSVTHMFNAQKPLHHREVGTVGSALMFDELNCEMICDLIHLSIPAIKLVIKNKPHDKITLITDSIRAKYLKDGVSELGGQEVFVKEGVARLSNGTLAGSTLKMNVAIKNLVTKCNVPLLDAVDFATLNPAKNLEIADKIGSIRKGKFADFCVLKDDFTVLETIRDGKIVYKA